MKSLNKITAAVIFSSSVTVSSAQAFVVDFELYGSLPGVPSAFLDVPDYSSANQTFTLSNQTFGNGGITFSGGILLNEPVDSSGVPGNTIIGDGGSVYYGTAFSPSTSITTSNYQNQLSISIDTAEMISSVQGSFVHGLNTEDIDGPGISVDYSVSYTLEGIATPFIQGLSAVFTDGDEVINFGFDSNSLMGSAMGALITDVEIVAQGYDFLNSDNNVSEWDYLLSSVRFNEGASPVPVPAALPLFISALLGGMVIARPRKFKQSSETDY